MGAIATRGFEGGEESAVLSGELGPSVVELVALVGHLAIQSEDVEGILPEGFVLPPAIYTVLLVLGLGTVAAVLYVLSPPVRNRTIVAFAPWMMTGGVLHAIVVAQGMPPLVEPLFEAPAVYATVGIVAGVVWIVGSVYEAVGNHSAARILGVVGTGVVVTFVVFALIEGHQAGQLHPLPAVLAIAGTIVAAAVTWILLGLYFTDSAAATSLTGVLVVLGQALDGVSTAVGYDVLGARERTPLAAHVLDAGAQLPTAEYIGAGWLFVLVKLLLASAIVVLFREWVKESPQQARLVLAFVAGVGLGPGTHNLLLFVLGGG